MFCFVLALFQCGSHSCRGRRCLLGEHLQSCSVLFLIVVIGRSRAARGREQHERAVVRRCNHMTCHTPLFNTYLFVAPTAAVALVTRTCRRQSRLPHARGVLLAAARTDLNELRSTQHPDKDLPRLITDTNQLVRLINVKSNEPDLAVGVVQLRADKHAAWRVTAATPPPAHPPL
jgi:hypothetical protein